MDTEEDTQKIADLEAAFQGTDQRFKNFLDRIGYRLGYTSTPEEREEFDSLQLLMIQQLEALSDAIRQRLETMATEAGQATSPQERERIESGMLILGNRRKEAALWIAQIDHWMSL